MRAPSSPVPKRDRREGSVDGSASGTGRARRPRERKRLLRRGPPGLGRLILGLLLVLGSLLLAYAAWPVAAAMAGSYTLQVYQAGRPQHLVLAYQLQGIGAASLKGPLTSAAGGPQPVAPTVPVKLPADLPASVHISVTAQPQELYNGCEVAALDMLLAYDGVPVSQPALAAVVPQAQPADPTTDAAGNKVWGDPDEGFVGHMDGSTSGGYAVYHRPLLRAAQNFDGRVVDVTGSGLAGLFGELARQHPVVVWLGGDGGLESWLTPSGKTITADWSEHAVLVVGYDSGNVYYADPANGSDANFQTRTEFARIWGALGQQALSLK